MPTPLESAQSVVTKAFTDLRGDPPAALVQYLADVLEWNSVLSLVSRKNPVSACERLLLESVELGERLQVERVARLADVGSGAGFPGFVWAIMYPSVEVILVERREKRALFLERTARKLAAGNVAVLARDLEDVSRETGSLAKRVDLVTAMAVGEPSALAEDVERLLVEDGRFASTVPRNVEPAVRLGSSLGLIERFDGKFGCYAIYRRGV